jgi:DNA ligase (NAD+)
MRLKFIGPNTIETLFHHGYLKNILDLFKLKDHKKEIKNIERFGDLKINKIIKAAENIETTEANLIGAIGIKGIRAKRAKLVLDIYNIDALLKMSDHVKGSTKAIKRIRTIGHKFAMTLLRGVAENKDLIIALRDLVKIKERKVEGDKYIVFTGFRDPDLVDKLEEAGIDVSDNLNQKTILVIAKNPNGDSVKLRRARQMGIPIIDVPKAYDMFKSKK